MICGYLWEKTLKKCWNDLSSINFSVRQSSNVSKNQLESGSKDGVAILDTVAKKSIFQKCQKRPKSARQHAENKSKSTYFERAGALILGVFVIFENLLFF